MTAGGIQYRPAFVAGALAVAASAVVAFLVVRHHEHGNRHSHAGAAASSAAAPDLHDWMHQQLELSPAQEAALHPHEERFAARRAELEAAIASASRRLADAVAAAGSADDAEVVAAIDALESLRTDLHHATLRHLFAMRAELDDSQSERLRQWTHDSIVHAANRLR